MALINIFKQPDLRIVCAANRHRGNGVIVLGARHFDTLMHNTLRDRKVSFPEDWRDCDQGFIDQFGNFHTRKEAWLIACAANQIFSLVGNQSIKDIGKEGIDLYSENLY